MIIQKFIVKHCAFVAFCISFILFLSLSLIMNIREYYFDSVYYFELADSFMSSGHFSLMTFTPNLRGILFPLLTHVFIQFGSLFNVCKYHMYMIEASLIASILVSCLPIIFEPLIRKRKYDLLFRLIPTFAIMLFWRGLFLYPLSDLYSFTSLIVALSLYSRIIYRRGHKPRLFTQMIYSLFAGMALYFAYNTRTIYLFPGIIAVPIILFLNRENGIRRNICILASTMVGIFSIGSIQAISNYANYGSFSIAIMYSNLFTFQLAYGIAYSQYETCLPTANYPGAAVAFLDPVGKMIFEKEKFNYINENLTLSQYINLLLKYPLDIVGIYIRHLINMLNPVFGDVYMSQLPPKPILTVLNYLLLFVSTIGIYVRNGVEKEKRTIKAAWMALDHNKVASIFFAFIAVLSCLFILPGAVEVRFFFPAYMILYGYAAFVLDYKKVALAVRNRPIWTVIAFIFIFLVLCSFWSATYASNTGNVFIPVL